MVNFTAYDQYDTSEIDPYTINDSECLVNLLGLTDTQSLNDAEAKLSSLNMADLEANPIPPDYTVEHLQRIHHRLFSDVYPFAGKFRKSEIAKGGHLFLPHSLVHENLATCLDQLHDEDLLRGLDHIQFATRAGHYLNIINGIHPFREGNGRSQRILINQLASAQGYAFHWDSISPQGMGMACREGRTTKDSTSLSRLLLLNIARIEE